MVVAPIYWGGRALLLLGTRGRNRVATTLASSISMGICSSTSGGTSNSNSGDLPVAPPASIDPKTVTFAGYTFDVPSTTDVACIEKRQLEHTVHAFAVGRRCKYGFPQAFGFHPARQKISSGLFRLSCPMLVEAIDEWEAEGAVKKISELVRNSPELTSNFDTTNKATAAIRRAVVEACPGGMEKVQEHFGNKTQHVLASGLSGISQGSLGDVKCLHAHAADYLCRNGENEIGREILCQLEEQRHVEIQGHSNCWQQCDLTHARQPGSWHYIPIKNQQRLRTTQRRRREQKAEIAKGALPAPTAV
jgi:hypothetical protein